MSYKQILNKFDKKVKQTNNQTKKTVEYLNDIYFLYRYFA